MRYRSPEHSCRRGEIVDLEYSLCTQTNNTTIRLRRVDPKILYRLGLPFSHVSLPRVREHNPNRSITIFFWQERVLLGLEGGTESCSRSGRSPAGGGTRAVNGISVGDRVVRGPGWSLGEDQDGGPGEYGTVIDVRRFGGRDVCPSRCIHVFLGQTT